MSDAETTSASDIAVDVHDDHGSGHGAGSSEPLGPVDVTTWAYALVGGAVGVIFALVMMVAGSN